jgi:aminoglycoside phosphotransferase (APT) family kinase protein
MEHFTGTKPVAESHAFDVAALQAHLQQHLPGFAGPLTVEQFKGGQSNPTYKLLTPARAYVMRSKPGPAAKLLPSAHAVEREFRVMRALAGTRRAGGAHGLLCEDEAVIGRAFYVMEFIDGRVLWDQALPGMAPAERAAIYDEMNRVIAALHQVDVAAAGLADYGKPGNYFERQIGRWSKQFLASVTEPIDEMHRLIEWLPAHIPAGAMDAAQVSVVHGDFRLDNLVFHPTEPRMLAVLDWELSTLGHPLADFSYHCMAWHIPPGVFRGIGGLDLPRWAFRPNTTTCSATASAPAAPTPTR